MRTVHVESIEVVLSGIKIGKKTIDCISISI